MKVFGYDIRKAAKEEISTATQIRDNAPQGYMTSAFQDYYMRKVSGEFYEHLREGIPIIDSAIRRLISLNGTIEIIGDNAAIVKELEDFCLNVPVNDTQKGIHAFLENASNETFEQGFSLSEFIATSDMKDIAGLRVADSKNIVYRRNADGRAEPWYRYTGALPVTTYNNPQALVDRILNATYGQSVFVSGMNEVKLNPNNKMYFSINNENTNPYGVSIMRSMEFVSKLLMTMQNSLGNVWERFGDPSYHVHYKTSSKDGSNLEARRQKISTDFSAAIKSKRAGKSADFVTAADTNSDIAINIIGAGGQVLQLDVPARHVLEQIVSKTNLPAWMLGIYWSTTERMATLEVEAALQDAKIRQLAMTPEFIRLFSTVLTLRGRKWKSVTTDPDKPGDWGLVFKTPNLRDLVAQAQAKFLNAQADMMQSGVNPNNTQTSVQVGAASYEINGMKFPLFSKEGDRGSCSCGKTHPHPDPLPEGEGNKARGGVKESRPIPHPALDKIEAEYQAKLQGKWGELKDRTFAILQLNQLKAVKDPGDPFTFSPEQRAQILDAMKLWIGEWKPSPDDMDNVLKWYYGQAYSLGLIQAAQMIGNERPVLDIIKNREIFNDLVVNGFELVKDNATKVIKDQIISEMEAQVIAGTNPLHVANRLAGIFDDANSNWERLARSEMTMSAERAKIDEYKANDIEKMHFYAAADACPLCQSYEKDYDINDVRVPVQDTHPRCYCTLGPVGEGKAAKGSELLDAIKALAEKKDQPITVNVNSEPQDINLSLEIKQDQKITTKKGVSKRMPDGTLSFEITEEV